MKLTFKDLKQQKFEIEAEPSENVGQVKQKISAEKGWDASQLKLIYSGKILQDDKTIETYNIEEKGFIVCMVSKPKAASSSATPSQAPSTPSGPATTTPAAPQAPAPSGTTATSGAPATPSPASGDPSFNDPSALLAGSQSEPAVAQMESMGFARADIDRAMRAAYFNPDRAVEYLLSGIPEDAQQPRQQESAPAPSAPTAPTAGTGGSAQPAQPAPSGDEPVNLFEAAAQAGGQGAGADAPRGAGAPQGGNLDSLRGNAHVQQLRQMLQQDPAMLENVLQSLAEGNPQMAQLINDNRDQFLDLLSGDDNSLPQGTQTISVTEEERDAIERLCNLGFERDAVIQAYFACDKNEELTANYLFEHPFEDDE